MQPGRVDILLVGTENLRIVILSDMHFGRTNVQPSQLRPLWQGADRLIINGDVAELADQGLRGAAARMVVELRDTCEADGVDVTLLSGNHDPMISDIRYLRLFGGDVFITHGDVLHPAISPWTSHRKQYQRLQAQTYAKLDPRSSNFEDRLATSQYASHFLWDHFASHVPAPADGNESSTGRRSIPSRFRRYCAMNLQRMDKVARALWYWRDIPQRAIRFARWQAPECRFFIFGHIHRSGIWHDHGRVIINTGAYAFPARPHAVVIDHAQLSVHRLRLHDGVYRFDNGAINSWPLYRQANAA